MVTQLRHNSDPLPVLGRDVDVFGLGIQEVLDGNFLCLDLRLHQSLFYSCRSVTEGRLISYSSLLQQSKGYLKLNVTVAEDSIVIERP